MFVGAKSLDFGYIKIKYYFPSKSSCLRHLKYSLFWSYKFHVKATSCIQISFLLAVFSLNLTYI